MSIMTTCLCQLHVPHAEKRDLGLLHLYLITIDRIVQYMENGKQLININNNKSYFSYFIQFVDNVILLFCIFYKFLWQKQPKKLYIISINAFLKDVLNKHTLINKYVSSLGVVENILIGFEKGTFDSLGKIPVKLRFKNAIIFMFFLKDRIHLNFAATNMPKVLFYRWSRK